MLSILYAITLIIAAATYAFILSRNVMRNNSQAQYALAYCQTKLAHRHPH